MRIAWLMLPLIGFQIVSASYFQAVGKPKEAMLLMLSRQVLHADPGAVAAAAFFGLDGVWASLPAADFGASLLTGVVPVAGAAAPWQSPVGLRNRGFLGRLCFSITDW